MFQHGEKLPERALIKKAIIDGWEAAEMAALKKRGRRPLGAPRHAS